MIVNNNKSCKKLSNRQNKMMLLKLFQKKSRNKIITQC